MPKRVIGWCVAATAAIALVLGMTTPASASITAEVWNTDGDRLVVRAEPTPDSAEITRLTEGTSVTLDCQTEGTEVNGTKLWDYLPEYDGYVTDAYIYTGHDGRHPDLGECEGEASAMVEGFDNSNNNPGTMDFDAIAQDFGFGIFKASESTDFVDVEFKERFQAAQGKIITGAYHFFDPRTDGVAQAEHNLAVLADAGYDVSADDTLPIMVDVEPNYVEEDTGFCFDTDAATMNTRLSDYIAHIVEVTGEKPIVYTNGEMINDCGLDTAPLVDHPLAVPAWYEHGEEDPQAAAQALGWDTWTIWQYRASIDLPGGDGVAALADRFHGDEQALAELAQG